MGDHNVSGRGAGATDSRGHFHNDRSNASAKIAHEIELRSSGRSTEDGNTVVSSPSILTAHGFSQLYVKPNTNRLTISNAARTPTVRHLILRLVYPTK